MSAVLITGVSSGLGHGLASAYLDRGATVLGTSRRAPEDLVGRDGFRFEACDLTDEDAVDRAFTTLLDGIDELEIAWLNAGVLGEIADLVDTPLADLEHTMRVNVWANKLVIDRLVRARIPVSTVITMSSGAAVNGSRGWNGYSISKSALNMLTLLYARELPDTHFIALAPGLVDTAMQDHLCALPEDERFPAMARLKAARGTDAMPGPRAAADMLIARLDELRRKESGSFVDVRHL